ncbi:MAG: response regulator, partial [Deltaproteobacteria bacterium]|nr:response regulator [Deltaproteobacteria bacterium]
LAANGPEALEVFARSAPDLLVIDIKMPGMDGIELLRHIREISKNVPAILCTAYGEYKQNFETWASDAYVVKSANLENLLKKIKELLAKHESKT